jgi:hypothetical protein
LQLLDVERRVRWWQARFRLQDWDIAVEFVDDLEDSNESPVWGLCYRFVDNKSALIQIRTPKTAEQLAEVEETVVHELLHCLIAPLQQKCPQPASVAAEEQVVWTLSPLLVQLGDSASGMVLARAMTRAGMKLAAGRSRSSGRTRTMDEDLKALLMKLLEMGDPEAMKDMIRTVLETMGGGGAAAEGEQAMQEGEQSADGEQAVAEAQGGEGEQDGGKKPFQRAAGKSSSIAVQALVAAARSAVEAPRKSKEERARELRLPKDIAALAVKLPDDEFEDFVQQVEPMARQSGPVRRSTQGEGTPRGGSPQTMSREAALARLPPDQRDGLRRAFHGRAFKPTVSRTKLGQLVMSHTGQTGEES